MGEEIRAAAEQKIDKELEEFDGGQKEKAVSSYVAKTLKEFCKNEKFAQAVYQSEKTLSDCCKEILEKAKTHISDFEVYKKAAKFYFLGSKVNFSMEIEVDESISQVNIDEEAITEKIEKKSTKKLKSKVKVEENDTVIQISLFGEV